jgi:glycosyltransferase involved in cell wall biosynthesis
MNPNTILHLYSNHKWTGPADHALNLVSWLQAHSDVKTFFACGQRRDVQNHLYEKALQRKLEFINGLYLKKHLSWEIMPDVFALKKIVAHRQINLLHCHQDNDALTAVLSGFGNQTIRTCYDGEPSSLNSRQRFSYQRTAKIMTASLKLQSHLATIFPGKDIQQVDIPVDPELFHPQPKNARLLAEFGLRTDMPIGGIVARVQKHRKFPLLLDAIAQVVKVIPDIRFLIVGRGTHIDTVARQPAILRGLDKHIIFTGYRKDDYHDVINLFDYKIFLVPGSDGSCRAVREALACGIPVIATRKGILPELINDGETGLLINDKPEELARAVITMTRDRDFQLQCSGAARQYAETILSPEKYVQKVTACYNSIIESATVTNNQ